MTELPVDSQTDPIYIQLHNLLDRRQLNADLAPMRSGDGTFVGVFVFEDRAIRLIDELYGDPQQAIPEQALAIASRIRDTRQAEHSLDLNRMIAGYPIWLRYGGNEYLKGCFVAIPPLQDFQYLAAIQQIIKLFADLFSERASAEFASRVAQRDYLALEQETALGSDQLASAINNLGSTVLLIDNEMRIAWINSLAEDSRSVIGRYCYEAAVNRDAPCDGCLVLRTFETGEPQQGPIVVEQDGVGTRYFKAATTPVFGKDGEVVRVLELINDVTEARTAETELSRYKHLVNSSEDFMMVCDERYGILAVNPKITRALGYTEAELIGKSVQIFFSDDDLDKCIRSASQARTLGMTMDTIDVVRKDGSHIPTQFFATYDPDHKVYECILRDISERLRMEEEIRRQNEELQAQNQKVMAVIEDKDRFFRSVSHELRTPLTSVIAFSELLIDDHDEPLTSGQKKALDRIAGNAQKLLSFVNDLLDLSKLEVHKMSVELTEVELKKHLEQLVSNMAPLAGDKNLDISLSVPDGLPKLITDEQKLGQIIVNLVSNAIKFTSEGGVEITAAKNSNSISISVRDTGIGIPAEDLDNIFKEFYQGSNRGAGQRGTGLGLSIAQKLTTFLGGSLTVTSIKNAGSTFTLNIPVSYKKS